MLLAAQALFDPLMLATPTELASRYLLNAYPANFINYSIFTKSIPPALWREMTQDFVRTLSFNGHLERARFFRVVSRNLETVVEGKAHDDEIVRHAAEYVNLVHQVFASNARPPWGVHDQLAKFVILYVFLLFGIAADLGASEAGTLAIKSEDPIRIFTDYPKMFLLGPLAEMAAMAELQYRMGRRDRGVLLDGMHMAYAPYVDMILSNDEAFLELSAQHRFYRRKVFHLSKMQINRVPLKLADYPEAQNIRRD